MADAFGMMKFAGSMHLTRRGAEFLTWTIEPVAFLPWLMKRVKRLGGRFITGRRVSSFDEQDLKVGELKNDEWNLMMNFLCSRDMISLSTAPASELELWSVTKR